MAHAKWIPRNDEWFDFFECSNCHKKVKEEMELCPKCGALMSAQKSMELIYNSSTGKWQKKKEPFITIDIETEEDYNKLCELIEFWNQHHKE